MQCYNQFAHIYDELINSDINYEEWSQVILNVFKEQGGETLDYLDLACGTGNLTSIIAGEFQNVWGVDLSEEMLIEADDKLRKQGIKAKLVCQNICDLNLNRKFDLITCALDSTNYIIDKNQLKNYFINVKKHLKSNGIFIFDINSYYKLNNILGNNVFTYDDEDVVYIWQNQLEHNIVDMFLTFFIKREGLYERFDEEHSERAYKEEEIEEIINASALKIVQKMNNYKKEEIINTTERIVYVLKNDEEN